ncbi:cytochrome P450 [Pseudonocardiaceae bacterium YIM PH 21723]|nr:cytochrome P450 [Pseudonocardiaceae bacterium YIM PH 21723]
MQVDLTDERAFAGTAFWESLALLRRHRPVYWNPDPDGGFWALTRYADITAVYGDTATFSSRFGMRLGSNPAAVASVAGRMLIVTDPPDHTRLKRVLAPAFTAAELHSMEGSIEQVVRELVTEAVAAEKLDFLDCAAQIPTRVACAMMGVARRDWDWLGHTTTEAFEAGDEQARAHANAEIFLFFADLLAHRRAHPGADLLSRIADTDLSDEEVIVNCSGVLAGANETTRYSAAGAVLAFMEYLEHWRLLRAQRDDVLPSAVEEVLRWTVPGMHVLRTAVRDTEIGGVQIRSGDRVTLWNGSANRDEAVFSEPDRFLITRTPNRHLGFGTGRHLCLGARLARLELTALLRELSTQVAEISSTGTAEFNASNFTWGLRSLPVHLTADLR